MPSPAAWLAFWRGLVGHDRGRFSAGLGHWRIRVDTLAFHSPERRGALHSNAVRRLAVGRAGPLVGAVLSMLIAIRQSDRRIESNRSSRWASGAVDDELRRNASSAVQNGIALCAVEQTRRPVKRIMSTSRRPDGKKPMTMISRSLIALGLVGSGVAAALVTLRKTRHKKDKREDDAAIRAWEGEGGSGSSSARASENVTYR